MDEEDYEHVIIYLEKSSKFKIKNIHPPKFLDRRYIFGIRY